MRQARPAMACDHKAAWRNGFCRRLVAFTVIPGHLLSKDGPCGGSEEEIYEIHRSYASPTVQELSPNHLDSANPAQRRYNVKKYRMPKSLFFAFFQAVYNL